MSVGNFQNQYGRRAEKEEPQTPLAAGLLQGTADAHGENPRTSLKDAPFAVLFRPVTRDRGRTRAGVQPIGSSSQTEPQAERFSA